MPLTVKPSAVLRKSPLWKLTPSFAPNRPLGENRKTMCSDGGMARVVPSWLTATIRQSYPTKLGAELAGALEPQAASGSISKRHAPTSAGSRAASQERERALASQDHLFMLVRRRASPSRSTAPKCELDRLSREGVEAITGVVRVMCMSLSR